MNSMEKEKLQEELYPIHIYKNPLKKNEGGYGYMGVMLQTKDGKKLQCHICGRLFISLHSHIKMAHEMSAKEYRKTYDLMHNTALVSDMERVKRSDRMVELRASGKWKAGSPESLRKATEMSRLACKGKPFKMSLEVKNKRGCCPDQIIDKIQQFQRDFGNSPTRYQFEDAYKWGKRYTRLAERTFGSWGIALEKAGLKINNERKPQISRHWDRDEILEMIFLFWKEEGRIPRFSDFRRGYLPHPSTVARRFGSLEKARELAGIYI